MSGTAANPENSAATHGAPEGSAVAASVARSIGERLRAGRERSGLSIAAAAEKLHLDPKVIDALEADRFAEVGASVYVRGHLRRYADFVGEAGGELVAMYTTREMPAAKPDLTQVPQAERRTDPRRLVTPMVALGAGGVLLAAIWWVLAGSGTSSNPAPAKPVTPVVSDVGAPVEAATSPITTVSLNAGVPATTPVQAPAPSNGVAAETPVAPAKEAPVREVRLQLELEGDSWVEVYDSRGERLFYDVASAGSVQSVAGRAPLRVVLGNAAGVTVQVDGETREIPAGAADGEGARFVVNRSGTLSRAR